MKILGQDVADQTRQDVAREITKFSQVIDVANDGEPIAVSAQEQIFVPFYTTKNEGSGIGLSISRQIMRNHNGSIELLRSIESIQRENSRHPERDG